MAEYSGKLAQKIDPPSVIGASDDQRWQDYAKAVEERHDALFREFGIEPPATKATTDPAWRDLALALARRHIPAFGERAGRPATSRNQHITWWMVSRYFQIKECLNVRDGDRRAAEYFGVETAVVFGRLKELRRETAFRSGGVFDQFIANTESSLGKPAVLDALGAALVSDPEIDQCISDEIERIRRHPY